MCAVQQWMCCSYPEQWRTPGWGCSCLMVNASSAPTGGPRPDLWPHPPPPYWTTHPELLVQSERAEPGLEIVNMTGAAKNTHTDTHTHAQRHSLSASRSAQVRQDMWRSRLSRCVRWARSEVSWSNPPDKPLLQDTSNSRSDVREQRELPVWGRCLGERYTHNNTQLTAVHLLPRSFRWSVLRPQSCSRKVVREVALERAAAMSLKHPPSTSCVSWGLEEMSRTQSLGWAHRAPPKSKTNTIQWPNI